MAAISSAECVLDLLARLLQVTHHLIGPAFGLKTPVTGDLASVALDAAAQLLNLVPELVREAHHSLLPAEGGRIPARHSVGPILSYPIDIRSNRAGGDIPAGHDC